AGGDLPERKPAPEPLIHLARALRAPPEALVMVGDGPQDIECARSAGARSVAVSSGFSSYDQLLKARPDVVLKSLTELPEVFERWREATARIFFPPPPKG